MKRFGLIGYPIGHSFSQKFFTKKFKSLGLDDHVYDVFEMESLKVFSTLWLKYEDLVGINVTIPHKEEIQKYLDHRDGSAVKVGASNVILRKNNKLIGFNTDYMAFKESLKNWVGKFSGAALILGSGGASKAVQVALGDFEIPFNIVSRNHKGGDYTYSQLKANPEIMDRFKLLINTTPVGMHPNIEGYPDLPYDALSIDHYLYDLVYNPEETQFMKRGKNHGAKVKNGMEMLVLQAEKSWNIWNS